MKKTRNLWPSGSKQDMMILKITSHKQIMELLAILMLREHRVNKGFWGLGLKIIWKRRHKGQKGRKEEIYQWVGSYHQPKLSWEEGQVKDLPAP